MGNDNNAWYDSDYAYATEPDKSVFVGYHGHDRRHGGIGRFILVVLLIVLALFACAFAYAEFVWKAEVPITIHTTGYDGVIEARLESTSDQSLTAIEPETFELSDGHTQLAYLPRGTYKMSFTPTFPLLADGAHSIMSHDDEQFTVEIGQDIPAIDVTFDQVDLTNSDSVTTAINATPAAYQTDAANAYLSMSKDVQKNIALAGVTTEQYAVTGLSVVQDGGTVTVSASLLNTSGRSMQWADVNFDLMSDDGRVVGTAQYKSDLIYQETSTQITATGFTTEQVSYAKVADVVWY